MMKGILRSALFAAIVMTMSLGVFPVAAQIQQIDNCAEFGVADCNPGRDGEGLIEFIRTIINVFLGLVGVVAVIFIIFGGVKFITSQGNTEQAASAKNTILYAVIGLLVIILSAAIVNFVINAMSGEGSSGGNDVISLHYE